MADAEKFINMAVDSWRRFSADFGDKMHGYGLTVSQSLMIREIGTHEGGISKIDLARALGVNRSMITNTLKGLGKYIIVTAVDKRKSLMTLSEEGSALYGRMTSFISESAKKAVESLSDEDIEALKNIVEKVRKGC